MKRLLLIGAGHAHAQVLAEWMARPLPDVELVLVSPGALAPYSGRVPGWLAGRHRYEDICIDFAALAAAAGARFVLDEAVALDAAQHRVALRSGALIEGDVISLNVGSTLQPPASEHARVLALRPLAQLRSAWEALLAEAAGSAMPLTVTAVGGGAAGVESLLAVLARLRGLQPGRAVHGGLVTQSAILLPGCASGAVRAALAALRRAGVTLQLGSSYCDTIARSSDVLLWATGAQAHAWPRASGLAVGEGGFIRVDAQLRSVSHPHVHAVGDCAEWAPALPKSGVVAVRMGPVLSHNLRAALGTGRAVPYVPQAHWLALLSTADGRAIASRGRWSAQGRWVAWWKDRLDGAFLRQYTGNNAVTNTKD